MFPPPPVPWAKVKLWACIGCGDCCRFSVTLSRTELRFFIQNNHSRYLQCVGSKVILIKTETGRCVFQSGSRCLIQNFKPLACKLWPFRLFSKPCWLGDPKLAEYNYQSKRYYVYVDARCPGIGLGSPTELVVSEVVKIAKAEKISQKYSTSPFL
jgi:Fe-S-cluster containining protein